MKTSVKYILLIFISLFSFFLFQFHVKAKVCNYKDTAGTKHTLEITKSKAVWDSGATLLTDNCSMGTNGVTGYVFMMFNSTSMFSCSDLTDNYTCPKYAHQTNTYNNGTFYDVFWLTDLEWNKTNIQNNTSMTPYYFREQDDHTTLTFYDPVDIGTKSCNAIKYSLETIYDDGKGSWNCDYNNTSIPITIKSTNGGNAVLSTSAYKTTLIDKFTASSIKSAKDCPKYIWVKAAEGTSSVISLPVYTDPNNADIKECTIEDKSSNTLASEVKQICTYKNLKTSSKNITIKSTVDSIYMDTGTGSILVYGKDSKSEISVNFNETDTSTICDNNFLLFKPSTTTCNYSTAQKLLSFSKEKEWFMCGDGFYWVDADKTTDSMYEYMYSQNTNWENPDYIDPNSKPGKTDDLDTVSYTHLRRRRCDPC